MSTDPGLLHRFEKCELQWSFVAWVSPPAIGVFWPRRRGWGRGITSCGCGVVRGKGARQAGLSGDHRLNLFDYLGGGH